MIEQAALTVAVIAIAAACVGICLHWNRSIFPIGVQFSLRSLLILLAVGPPVLATAWTHRDSLLQTLDRALAPVPPLAANPSRRQPLPRQQYRQATQRPVRNPLGSPDQQTSEQKEVLHFLSGVSAAVLYPLAVVLTAGVFWTASSWRRPPKKTPLLWAAMLASLSATAAFLMFVLTHPRQESASEAPFRDYERAGRFVQPAQSRYN